MRRTISLLIAVVLILVGVGMVMLASASTVRAYELEGDAGYFVKRQLVWLIVTVIASLIASRLDYRFYARMAVPIACVSIFLLLLVWSPIGRDVNGSTRWIQLGPGRLQPSEVAKLSLIILFAWWLAGNQRRIDELKRGILIPFGMLGCFILPIVAEPDFGTTMLASVVCIFMMFLAGVWLAPMLVLSLIGLVGVIGAILQNPERLARLMAFADIQEHAKGKAWQLVNSLKAFASGGWSGLGPGNSMQKRDYLPEAYTDFILPIIGEELGLIATMAVLLLFLILFLCGITIAMRARDDFGRFMAFGITLMITIQALINFSVVTGCVPTKGIALPFISYGGSSLLVSGVMIGILVNIALGGMHAPTAAERNPFKDRVRTA